MLPALLVLALAALAPAVARRHAPYLHEDEPARRTTRPAECLFGKQAKELGSKWFADLGPPFGVMYCIKCECVPVQKKRRVVAKVSCRNIKNECPEPTCDTPELQPGRCCKTCPGDINSPDIVQEDSPVVYTAEEDEHNMKYFASILTGRSPLCVRRDDMSGVPVGPGVATARFTFRRRHLYWSVLLSPSISAQPRALAFLDRIGRVLLEQPLKKIPGIHSTYEEKTDKLCGVWRRVPRQYKTLLRDGDLHVALLWGDDRNSTIDSALSGRIDRYPALSSEMFTTLLEPEHPPTSFGQGACRDYRAVDHEDGWWGGTAVITGVAGATPSLYLALMFNGVFPKTAATSHLVRVVLTLPEKNQTIIDQRVNKPNYDFNVLEVSTPVSAAELRSLARGRLLLTVEAVDTPERRLVGSVRQKAACEVYHAPLVSERAPASPAPEGLALIYIDKEGSLVYDIQMDNLSVNDPKITLVEEQGKRHSQVEILDTRIGVLARPSARIFQPLYEDTLAVHVSGDAGPPILRGRLTSRLMPDAAGSGPALLRRTSQVRVPMTMAGLAWLSVDSLCGLYYEAVVTGGNSRTKSSWWLETHAGGEGNARELGADEGWILEPTAAELVALHVGAAYLELRSHDNVTALLRTRVPQISVPPSCLPAVPGTTDNELSAKYTPGPLEDQLSDALYRLSVGYCKQGEKFYKLGEIWTDTESCSKCSCVLGMPRCEPVQCPQVTCLVPTIQPPGQCCPICTNSTSAKWTEEGSCTLAGQTYAPGSSWHPYLVPGGYDTCAICTCNFATKQIQCPRVQCPPLRCSEKEAYRPDKKACCRVCPEAKAKKPDEETPKDQGTPRTAEEILAEGGCKFPDGPLPNGKEVHPSIHSHGEQRCVTCRCKDGEVTCVRKRCGRAACSRRRRVDACCVCTRHRRQRAPRPDRAQRTERSERSERLVRLDRLQRSDRLAPPPPS
ncbi:dorsal-ventral patterning protein Sog isoform X1 [Manduca sexta]|uniref:dorsal-ventral patterning protein Sog isoform X1 n=1 Tax=Manduca sexta TaxID=7130 RepID=UPI001182883E|nr:dorsal-ventral patterning protein Sog isoform X1 [Manduca sexta]